MRLLRVIKIFVVLQLMLSCATVYKTNKITHEILLQDLNEFYSNFSDTIFINKQVYNFGLYDYKHYLKKNKKDKFDYLNYLIVLDTTFNEYFLLDKKNLKFYIKQIEKSSDSIIDYISLPANAVLVTNKEMNKIRFLSSLENKKSKKIISFSKPLIAKNGKSVLYKNIKGDLVVYHRYNGKWIEVKRVEKYLNYLYNYEPSKFKCSKKP